MPAVFIGVAALIGLAATSWQHRRLSDSPRQGLGVVFGVFAVPTNLAVAGYLGAGREQAATESVVTGLIALACFLVVRTLPFSFVWWRRNRGIGLRNVLIVGCDATGRRLAEGIRNRPERGLQVIGHVDDVEVAPTGLSAPLLGGIDQLADVVRHEAVDVVMVAFASRQCRELVNPLRSIDRRCEVYVVPRCLELDGDLLHRDREDIDGILLLRLHRRAFRALSWRVKRWFDVAVATAGIVITAPILIATAIAVRLETGPGVIFKQERIGLDSKPFTLYKFRSLKPVAFEGDVMWNIDTDPRLGTVGRIIRATSLDELPQLFNILKGDMSLVGPRPERPFFVEQFSQSIPGYQYRHRVPAGLTGFAVVHGLRGDTSIEDRSYFDNLYAESWSLWLDLKIMLRTSGQVWAAVAERLTHRTHASVPLEAVPLETKSL